jgi:non-heme chloroperoxidase
LAAGHRDEAGGVSILRSATMPDVATQDRTESVFVDWGRGQPIVFHHGRPLSADDDTQLMFVVQRGDRVVAHDRRGHGRSTQTSDGHDLDTYAADAAAVVEHLGLRDAARNSHASWRGATLGPPSHCVGRVDLMAA